MRDAVAICNLGGCMNSSNKLVIKFINKNGKLEEIVEFHNNKGAAETSFFQMEIAGRFKGCQILSWSSDRTNESIEVKGNLEVKSGCAQYSAVK